MSQRIPPVMTVEERRSAALRATETARRGADRPRIVGAAFGLCAGLALSACVPEVKSGTQDSGVVALYNPSSSPAVVPAPNDLVRVGGKLQIPTDPNEAKVPALKAFNDYLRSLDGYPPDSTASTSFAADLDPATIADNVAIYDVTEQRLLTSAETLASLVSGEASRLEVKAPTRWKGGHSYVIAVLSWLDQGVARGVKSADGKRLLADQAFTFLRSERPLIGRCADGSNADCACPSLTDATCKAIVDGISDTQARQLELGRLTMAPGLSALLTAKGRARADVAVAWSFTVSKRPFAVFDSGRAQIPFPSDLLLDNPIADPGKAKVNLPIAPDEKEPFKSLKMGLNTLDGFSTTGSATFPVDSTSDIDAASVSKLTTVFVNLNNPADAPSYTPAPLTAILNPQTQTTGFAGQIWLTPDKPLNPDQNRYAAIVTTAIKDKTGQPLTPAPATFLLTQGNPLVVDGKSAISSISLSNATQLEFLRSKAVQPLLDALAKNPQAPKPSQIAALTIFRTQSVAAPLLALSAAPSSLQVPTDVTFDTVIRDPATLPGVGALIHGTMKVAQLVSDLGPLTSPLNPKVKTIPFLMTLPKKAAVPTARVAIVQHGFTRWRGDAVALAPALAAGGMALFAIDINYHGGRVVCVTSSDCGCSAEMPPVVFQPPAPALRTGAQ